LKKQEAGQLLDALEKDWESKHNCLFHNSLPPLVDAPKPKGSAKPSCVDVGVCLCGEAGNAKWKLKKWVASNLSNMFGAVQAKKAVNNGDVVLRFSGNSDRHGDDAVSADLSPDVDLWCHVSHVVWSPWLPVFRRIVSPTEGCIHEVNDFQIEATHVYETVWELSDTLHSYGQTSWSVRGYEMSTSQVPLVELRPTHVHIRATRTSGTPLSLTVARSGAKKARTDAWAAALDELDDVGSGDESDEALAIEPPPGRSPRLWER